MPNYRYEREIDLGGGMGRRRGWLLTLIIVVAGFLIFARSAASFLLDYEWWKELGQIDTWKAMILYGSLPVAVAALVVFVLLWIAHARGMKEAGVRLREFPLYAKLSTLALLLLSIVIARAALDSWTVVRFAGSRGVSDAGMWRDPVFGKSLAFFMFDLPFWSELLRLFMATMFFAVVINALTSRLWGLRHLMRPREDGVVAIDARIVLENIRLSALARTAAALFLVGFAANLWLNRFDLAFSDHGFMVGVDYVDEWVRLPMQWVAIAAALAGAVFALMNRWRWLVIVVAALLLRGLVPSVVSYAYVRPNELSLQSPYIKRHIDATRAAYGFDQRLKETQFAARLESATDLRAAQPLFENVRLWDWRAYHDIVTQIQALRQYYDFPDSDVDRYRIEGQTRQVMVAPRELDISQVSGGRGNWINTSFIYTHGYGLVMAPAARVTPEGQPVLWVQDAPPKINVPGLQITRPELYFGEKVHEPVYVRTTQPEFSYPAGSEAVSTKYEGRGGIPISPLVRFAAALQYGDGNLLLTNLLTSESRMLIRRNVRQRLNTLADFLSWDADPYLVVTQAGRLVWMVDGYTTSDAHPYSRRIQLGNLGSANYIRNSVKAAVDAYDGTVQLYVFDDRDPVIRAWQSIFPRLFRPAADMPADLREHVRYPELLFRTQVEMYRTYHMTDPETFYNKEDLWDLAKENYGQNAGAEAVQPTFIIATLPGETKPEFLLVTSFTPRAKDNMIGVMAARSDPDKLGQLVVLQLSKQALIYGPLQIEARIDSDQVISKDLTLWNQQGSQVLRGQLLVLPLRDTFVYVEPIYLRSAQASMPQLKKVVLAMGNRLIYRDTLEQAVAELTGGAPLAAAPGEPSAAAAPVQTSQTQPAAAPARTGDARLEAVRGHLRRYRELMSQGRFGEAGRELEALEAAVGQR